MARVNVVLSDETERKLRKAAPRGMRSQVVEEALAEYLGALERKRAFSRLRKLVSKAPAVPTAEIVADLRRDRRGR